MNGTVAYIRKLLDGLDGMHLSCYHDASGINVLHILLTYMYLIFLLEVWEKPLCWVGNPSTKAALSIQELQILLSMNRRVLGWLLMHSG